MKGVVAFGFFMLFLAGFALVSLSNRSAPDNADLRPPLTTELLGDRWRLVAMRGAPGANTANITLQFTRGGMLTGNGPCQHFSARYRHEDLTLSFTDIEAMPPSGCATDALLHEQTLLHQLAETAAVTMDAGNLVFVSGDSTRLVRFTKVTGK